MLAEDRLRQNAQIHGNLWGLSVDLQWQLVVREKV